VMSGYDKLDITSVPHPREDYVAQLSQPVSGLRIGMPMSYFDGLHPEVASAVQAAVNTLTKMTRSVTESNLPGVTHLGSLGTLGETFAYHEEFYKRAAAKYMLPERRRLQTAAEAEVKAVDYIRAKWEVELVRRKVDDAFTDVDLMVVPKQRILPPQLDELIKRAHDPTPANPRVVSNCQPFNVFGVPAVSIPCGFSKSGLPIGLMIVGPHFAEGKVLALAQAYEKATQWHQRKPTLTPNMAVPPVMAM
jgi:aspartyl-tRNA(Asn)/glutamyl-tRNA(Gln) amidotransferase subunit A